MSDSKCYNCNKPGHIARDCPTKSAQSGAGRGGPRGGRGGGAPRNGPCNIFRYLPLGTIFKRCVIFHSRKLLQLWKERPYCSWVHRGQQPCGWQKMLRMWGVGSLITWLPQGWGDKEGTWWRIWQQFSSIWHLLQLWRGRTLFERMPRGQEAS